MIPLNLFGLLLILLLIYVLRKNRKTFQLPPGPSGIPIVGYLPWIDAKCPYLTLTELTKKYGPICGLQMGSIYTVLLSDPQLVRQALAKDVFAGRAPLYLTHGIMQGYGIVCAEGDRWRDQRKFVAGCLKNFGMVKLSGTKRDRMEERILAAVNESISRLKKLPMEGGIDPLETLHHCLGNLMNDLVFGKVYENHDEVWKYLRYLQEEGVKHIGVAGPLNFLPFLRFLPRYKKIMTLLIGGKIKTHQIYQKIIDDYRARPEKTDNFLAAFNEAMSKADNEYYTQQQYYHLLADLYGAGVDTTLATFRWILLFMALYPDEQKKIQNEMNELLGQKQPILEDRPLLIRLEAAILESQRLRSITPVGIPHGAIEDTQLNGYDIPKGTMIIPLQWAIHTNPMYWDDPLSYKPERFITEDGSIVKPKAFLPYQMGKRMCVGDELAKMILFLFTARFLHSFIISVPLDTQLDMEGICGLTLVPKSHRLIFTSRE
ncbi:hypothetical protein P5V15_005936 [Pogonomyrmex californicus]